MEEFELKLKESLELLKATVIDIEDYFIYNTSIIRVTLDEDSYYVCADDEQEALDNVIDHLENTDRHLNYVYSLDEIEEMKDKDLENCTCVGNHCYFLKVPFNVAKCLE